MSEEIGIEEARKNLGDIANRAYYAGQVTYITRRGQRVAAVVPTNRVSQEPAVVLTKTLSDGRTATISRHVPDGTEVRAGGWDVSIDGQPYTNGDMHLRPKPGGKPGEVIKAIGTRKVIGLSEEEAATLQAVLDAEHEEWKRSPKGQRFVLLGACTSALSAWEKARAAVANEDVSWELVVDAERTLDKAEQALNAFDDAHPEMVVERWTKRQREHDEAVERALRD